MEHLAAQAKKFLLRHKKMLPQEICELAPLKYNYIICDEMEEEDGNKGFESKCL